MKILLLCFFIAITSVSVFCDVLSRRVEMFDFISEGQNAPKLRLFKHQGRTFAKELEYSHSGQGAAEAPKSSEIPPLLSRVKTINPRFKGRSADQDNGVLEKMMNDGAFLPKDWKLDAEVMETFVDLLGNMTKLIRLRSKAKTSKDVDDENLEEDNPKGRQFQGRQSLQSFEEQKKRKCAKPPADDEEDIDGDQESSDVVIDDLPGDESTVYDEEYSSMDQEYTEADTDNEYSMEDQNEDDVVDSLASNESDEDNIVDVELGENDEESGSEVSNEDEENDDNKYRNKNRNYAYSKKRKSKRSNSENESIEDEDDNGTRINKKKFNSRSNADYDNDDDEENDWKYKSKDQKLLKRKAKFSVSKKNAEETYSDELIDDEDDAYIYQNKIKNRPASKYPNVDEHPFRRPFPKFDNYYRILRKNDED